LEARTRDIEHSFALMSSPVASERATAAPEAPDKTPAPEATATSDAADAAKPEAAATSDAAEAKEEEDCGFCTYMRAGPCGEVFTAWEKCVEDHRSRDEDFAKGCVPATRALTECMSEHKDYYELPDQEEPAPAPETAPIAAATVADAPTTTASVESAGGDAAESRAAA
jgi:hypothetical protein